MLLPVPSYVNDDPPSGSLSRTPYVPSPWDWWLPWSWQTSQSVSTTDSAPVPTWCDVRSKSPPALTT